MCDWDDEETVTRVRNTCERVVPSQESSEDTKCATSFDSGNAWCTIYTGEVTDSEAHEGEIQREEEEEERDRRPQCTDKEEEGEDEPAHQEEAERI